MKAFHQVPLTRNSKALVSFPIILLLLFILSLSYDFYQQLAANRQWSYQQQKALNDQSVWQAFAMNIAISPSISNAKKSQCDGFCSLEEIGNSEWNNQYQFEQSGINYQLYWFISQNSLDGAYYRLCAQRKMPAEGRCWWYQSQGGSLVTLGVLPVAWSE